MEIKLSGVDCIVHDAHRKKENEATKPRQKQEFLSRWAHRSESYIKFNSRKQLSKLILLVVLVDRVKRTKKPCARQTLLRSTKAKSLKTEQELYPRIKEVHPNCSDLEGENWS
jgi:hypothetical protein